MSLEETELVEKYRFENIYYQRVKSYCKVFSSFVFAGTYIFVAHGRILTLFDVQKKTIFKHLIFEREILDVFRASAPIINGQTGSNTTNFDIVVVLQQGLIKVVTNIEDIVGAGGYDIDERASSEMQEQIHGYYCQHGYDKEENKYALIMTTLDKKQRLYCYHQR